MSARGNRAERASDHLQEALFKPTSRWQPPKDFPDLSGESKIGLDVETCDPNLTSGGPGFIRGDAHLAGVGISTMDRRWYFPVRHVGGGNIKDSNSLYQWLNDVLSREDLWVVGANLQYECEALDSVGVGINGKLVDVQIAEALIDEEQLGGYSLDAICARYDLPSKDERLLREAASAYGIDPKHHLYKLPSWYVGPYAEYDSHAPLLILQKQLKSLEEQDLTQIFEIESRLLPLLWQMRRQGIPIDLDAAAKLESQLSADEKNFRHQGLRKFGIDIDEWSGPQLAAKCDELNIPYLRTAKGNPSFDGEWLDHQDHPFLQLVADLREVSRFKDTFIKKWIFDNHVNGRIHCQWKQLASDDGGTRTGRMAASNPNPQQVPAGKYRTTGKPSPVGKAIRAMFRAPAGSRWCKMDWSQQEPRILTHFAATCKFTGAQIARMAYQTNPDMDFYNYMMEAAGIDRRPAKDMYLGRCYGMGIDKLAKKLNCSKERAREILADFDRKVPFVKEIAESCTRAAEKRGYIRTILGRRRHFNFYEPAEYGRMPFGDRPLPYKLAKDRWGDNIKRSGTHKALNALIQGSAADMIKAALLKVHDETGIVPYMAVHDEIDLGVPDEATAMRCKGIAEHCVDMTVPMKIEMEMGDTWK